MSSSRARCAAALATPFIFAGCSDVVAPVVNRMEAVAATISNLVTCDNTWMSAVDGQWSEAAKWSAGHVPTAGENVCITKEGSYTVYVIGFYSANTVTVSAPGNVTKPKLAIAGYHQGAGWAEVLSRLTVANGVDNYGWMELTSLGGPNPGYAQLILTGGTFYNHDISSFRSVLGTGTNAGRYLGAPNVINEGTMALDVQTTVAANVTNSALFNIAAAVSLNIQSANFTQNDGSLIDDGALTVSNGTFTLNGGTLQGNPPVVMGGLTIGSDAVPATIIVRGFTNFNGNVGPSQVIQVEGWQLAAGWNETPASLKWESGFLNRGTIRLTSTGGPMNGSSNLTSIGGRTVVNEGRIEVLVGLGNVRSITAPIDNRTTGVVDVQQNMSYAPPLDAVTTNNGLWKVAAGKRFFVQSNQQTFRQNGGTLDVTDAQFQHTGAPIFEMNGGAILGEPWVQGMLRIGTGSTATGRIFMTAQSQLIGDVMPDQTVTIAASDNTHGTLTAPASFTNRGTIIMTSIGTNTGYGALIVPPTATITNAPGGRIETYPGTGFVQRNISGNFVNEGTLHVTSLTFLLGPTIHTSGPITGGAELRNWGGTMFASGNMQANFLNSGTLHIGQSVGAAGKLDITGYFYPYSGTVNFDIGGSVPGVDFDKVTATDWAYSNAGLNVATTIGGCAGGGSSYEIVKGASHSGDWSPKTGLNLGNGRTVTTVPGATNYVLNVSGPVCIPPDITAPIIVPTVTGTLGLDGWYTSNVDVTWSVTDAESAVTSKTGCGASSVTSDNAGTTFTCSATSAGGTESKSVTIKRDATPPTVQASRAPAANANGWNNTSVTASWSASDGMSGLAGSGAATQLFSAEGENQGASRTFSDNAGNTASASVAGISIDKTKPTVTASRAPAANADGWNNSDVTATWTANDGLSGIDGSASATQLFSDECENAAASRTFTDLAGNSASAGVSGINIDKTAPVVTVTRSPAAGADGWNETDVTVTYSATDAFSGINGAASVTQVFSLGENQGGSQTFADFAGNSATGTISGINVRRPPPPPPSGGATGTASPGEIWPANNKMVAVKVTMCAGVSSFTLRSVTNNETGNADVEGWAIGTADLNGFVRASRNGGGKGRTYTLVYDTIGTNGAAGTCTVTVYVPHDQGKK